MSPNEVSKISFWKAFQVRFERNISNDITGCIYFIIRLAKPISKNSFIYMKTKLYSLSKFNYMATDEGNPPKRCSVLTNEPNRDIKKQVRAFLTNPRRKILSSIEFPRPSFQSPNFNSSLTLSDSFWPRWGAFVPNTIWMEDSHND